MAFHVLTDKGKAVTRSSVYSLTSVDHEKTEIKDRKEVFTTNIDNTIGNYSHSTSSKINYTDVDDPYKDIFLEDDLDDEDIEFLENKDFPLLDNIHSLLIPGQDDNLIGSRVQLPHQGVMIEGTIVSMKRNSECTLIG